MSFHQLFEDPSYTNDGTLPDDLFDDHWDDEDEVISYDDLIERHEDLFQE